MEEPELRQVLAAIGSRIPTGRAREIPPVHCLGRKGDLAVLGAPATESYGKKSSALPSGLSRKNGPPQHPAS